MRDSEDEGGDCGDGRGDDCGGNDVMGVSFGRPRKAVKPSSECLDKTLTGFPARD
ncbi:hypothetical protein GCM10023335_08540 [Streptomyces siamensis]|uniref:Uncharacterized protein n=1 Tax=Streptomyces siamensis TaxID=1274986 RepID=A0ABP9IGT2_9ACTN